MKASIFETKKREREEAMKLKDRNASSFFRSLRRAKLLDRDLRN